jgi:hypothetical protein
MITVSQEELTKLLSAGHEKQTPTPAGQPETPVPRSRIASRWHTKSFPHDDSCAITQEELNRVLAKRE